MYELFFKVGVWCPILSFLVAQCEEPAIAFTQLTGPSMKTFVAVMIFASELVFLADPWLFRKFT